MGNRYKNSKENTALYRAVEVKGGFGTSKASLVRHIYGNRGRSFWIYLSRPLSQEIVSKRIIEVFGNLVDDVHQTKMCPVEMHYFMHLVDDRPLDFVHNKCVEALGELCI